MLLDDTLQKQLAKKLRDIQSDIEAAEIPPRFARLLGEPPDDRPPRDAPGQRIPRATTSLLKKWKPQSASSHRNRRRSPPPRH